MDERVLYEGAEMNARLEEFLQLLVDFFEAADRNGSPLRIVGIRRRGDTLARRLDARLRESGHDVGELGVLDITLYRDDFSPGRRQPMVRPSEIPFEMESADVLLIDDVFQTGRTIRAALNQLADFGRPRRVTLAVFVDRDMRELPIRPDLVGLTIDRPRQERVQLRLEEDDGRDAITTVDRGGDRP